MAAKKPAKKAPPKIDPLHYIHESLRPLAEPLDSLTPNADNPVKHDEAAIVATMKSLEKFDMRAVLVVRESDRVIVDGHCRYDAALRLGWTHLPVIFVDDDEAETIAFAAASRATVELGQWIDDELLAKALAKVHAHDAELFDVLGLEALCSQAGDAIAAASDAAGVAGPETWIVSVECDGKAQQKKLYKQLVAAGYKVKTGQA